MNESNLKLPDYIKPSYSFLKKRPKKEKEVSPFKKSIEILNKILVNIPFCEALELMHVYAKFIKEILLGKLKMKHDENISLVEGCNAINQFNIPFYEALK